MESFWPGVMGVLRHISSIQPFGPVTPEQRVFLTGVRQTIIRMVRGNGEDISRALAVYDSSFSDLVANQAPKAFRDFLLSAPYMFLDLGEKLGAISHIVSFWHYRFPPGGPVLIDAEELSAIFQDFSSGFGERFRDEPAARMPSALRA
jgi:hypothetical protein